MGHLNKRIDFTTSAFILHPTEPLIALLLHNKSGKWLQPGGHIEIDEDPIEALTREIEEETGLQKSDWDFILQDYEDTSNRDDELLPKPYLISKHVIIDGHNHVDFCYIVKSNKPILTDSPDGASELRWCGIDEINTFNDEGKLFTNTYDSLIKIFNNINKV